MKINLSPSRRDETLSLTVAGEVLTLNGVDLDLSGVGEGVVMSPEDINCPWVTSATRTGGELELTLILPHGASAPHETLWPAPLTITADGPVELPAYEVIE